MLDIDQRVTEQVTREFSRRTRARVQNTRSGADAVLTGIITQYGVVPLSYDDEGRANRFQVTMAAKITLTGKDGDILYRSENVRFSEGYESASLPDEYAYEEGLASETVAGDFARSLVGNILEASGSAPGRKGEGAEAAGSGGGWGP